MIFFLGDFVILGMIHCFQHQRFSLVSFKEIFSFEVRKNGGSILTCHFECNILPIHLNSLVFGDTHITSVVFQRRRIDCQTARLWDGVGRQIPSHLLPSNAAEVRSPALYDAFQHGRLAPGNLRSIVICYPWGFLYVFWFWSRQRKKQAQWQVKNSLTKTKIQSTLPNHLGLKSKLELEKIWLMWSIKKKKKKEGSCEP